MKILACALAVGSLAACGSPSNSPSDDDPAIDAPDGTIIDSAPPPGYTTLISRPWTLGANVHDDYQCVRTMVDHDMWIVSLQAINPLGTHHQVLTISDSKGTGLGEYHCNAGSGPEQERMLYASGIGTDPMDFPAGYAVHVKAGQYLNLNLHLFNSQDNTLGGESGVAIKTVDAATNPTEVGFMFGGTYNLNGAAGIPSDGQDHTYSGNCNAKAWKLFALWPHMHQIAVHQKVDVIHQGTRTTIHDDAYSFMDQKFYQMGPMDLAAGDTITVSCTYNNNTGHAVTWGDASTDEMCFTGFYTSPPPQQAFECASF